jgi:hypothetical protein
VVKLAAQVIGLLTTVFLLVVWGVINNQLPVPVGLGGNVAVIVGSVIVGLLTYVNIMR